MEKKEIDPEIRLHQKKFNIENIDSICLYKFDFPLTERLDIISLKAKKSFNEKCNRNRKSEIIVAVKVK